MVLQVVYLRQITLLSFPLPKLFLGVEGISKTGTTHGPDDYPTFSNKNVPLRVAYT